MVVVKSFVNYWCSWYSADSKVACLVLVINVIFRPDVQFATKFLFVSLFFVLQSQLFCFLFSLFLIHLCFQGFLHFALLLFSLLQNDILFIPALKNCLSFKFYVHSVFRDTTPSFNCWKVSLRLHRAIEYLLLLRGLALGYLWDIAVSGCSVLFLLNWLLSIVSCWKRFIWIKCERRKFSSVSDLIFESLFVAQSDLLLQLFCSLSLQCFFICFWISLRNSASTYHTELVIIMLSISFRL